MLRRTGNLLEEHDKNEGIISQIREIPYGIFYGILRRSVPENLPDLRSIVLVPMIEDPSLVPFFALFLPPSKVRRAPLFSSPHRASAIKSRTRLIDLSSPTEKLGPVRSLVGDALGDDCLPITDLRDFLCFCVVSCILLVILA